MADAITKTVSELTIKKPNDFHVEIPIEEFLKMMFYIRNFDLEISGFGSVYERMYEKRRWLEVKKIYLLEQECTSAETEIDEQIVSKFIQTHERIAHRMRLWWHSHAKMSVFWSGTDEKNIQTLHNNDYLLSIVGNHAKDVLGRLDVFHPGHIRLNGLKIFVNCEKISDAKFKDFLYTSFMKNEEVFVEDLLFNDDFLKESQEILKAEITTKVKRKSYTVVSVSTTTKSVGHKKPSKNTPINVPSKVVTNLTIKELEQLEQLENEQQIQDWVKQYQEHNYSSSKNFVSPTVRHSIDNIMKSYLRPSDYQIFKALLESKKDIFSLIDKNSYHHAFSKIKDWAIQHGYQRPSSITKPERDTYLAGVIEAYQGDNNEIFAELEGVWVDSLIRAGSMAYERWIEAGSFEDVWYSVAPIPTIKNYQMFFNEAIAFIARGDIRFDIGLDILETIFYMHENSKLLNLNKSDIANIKIDYLMNNEPIVLEDEQTIIDLDDDTTTELQEDLENNIIDLG